MTQDTTTNKSVFIWAAAIVAIALLNIAEILPDWTTFAAILTLPFAASISRRQRCGQGR